MLPSSENSIGSFRPCPLSNTSRKHHQSGRHARLRSCPFSGGTSPVGNLSEREANSRVEVNGLRSQRMERYRDGNCLTGSSAGRPKSKSSGTGRRAGFATATDRLTSVRRGGLNRERNFGKGGDFLSYFCWKESWSSTVPVRITGRPRCARHSCEVEIAAAISGPRLLFSLVRCLF